MNANAAQVKAESFMQDATKALNRFSIFSSGTKFEDAADAYEKAGNQYKIAKQWQEAGTAYSKCADMKVRYIMSNMYMYMIMMMNRLN